jgi:hypothetical protein
LVSAFPRYRSLFPRLLLLPLTLLAWGGIVPMSAAQAQDMPPAAGAPTPQTPQPEAEPLPADPSQANPSQGDPAQADPAQAGPIEVEGRLLLGEMAADSGTVVLHRVTPEEAGAIDSVRVTSDGGFQLQLPYLPVRGSGEVFFASHRYQGILYFGPPLALAEQLDSVYEIQAYATRIAPAQGLVLPVSVRNLFVEEGPMGWRVTDLVEIRNDSAVTWIPDPDTPGATVWSYPLPSEAASFRVGEGDLSPGTVTWEDGVVSVRAPVLPGDRLLVFHYEIPTLTTEFPLPGTTGVLELLVRQPAPPLRVDGLQAAGPMEIERGVNYFRWWGEGLQDQVIRVRPGEEGGVPVAWVAVGLAFVLALAGGWLILGRSRPSFVGGGVGGPEMGGGATSEGLGAPGTVSGASGAKGGRDRTGGAESPSGPASSAQGEGATPFARRRALLLAIARLDEEGEQASTKGESQQARRERQARREALLAKLEAVEVELRSSAVGDGSETGGGPG